MTNNGWREWKNSVLGGQTELKEDVAAMRKEISDIKSAISALKVKSGMWGLFGGIAVVLTMMAVSLLARFIG